MTYDGTLLASDGTDASEAAVDHTVRFADAFRATLHVVYVLDATEHPPGVEDPGENPELEAKRERALTVPTERAEAAGIEVTSVAVHGEGGGISDTIVAYAREHDVDFVVMGTHGRSGPDRILLRSVAENVVRNAPVPVFTVRTESRGQGRSSTSRRNEQ